MRSLFILVAVIAAPFVRGDAPAKPLTPAEAATKVNEQVTVRMEVKNVGKARDGSVIFLRRNSVRREVRGLQFPPQDNRKGPHIVVFN